jgi:Flp pilus assembly protein TadG
MRPRPRDRGGISILFAIGMTAVMMIIGLSVDGGGRIREAQRANDIAAEAARAGGQQIDVVDAIAGAPTVLDQDAARAAVQSYLNQAAAADGITVHSYSVSFPDTLHISVTLQLDYHTVVLAFIGVGNLTANGSGTAALVLV